MHSKDCPGGRAPNRDWASGLLTPLDALRETVAMKGAGGLGCVETTRSKRLDYAGAGPDKPCPHLSQRCVVFTSSPSAPADVAARSFRRSSVTRVNSVLQRHSSRDLMACYHRVVPCAVTRDDLPDDPISAKGGAPHSNVARHCRVDRAMTAEQDGPRAPHSGPTSPGMAPHDVRFYHSLTPCRRSRLVPTMGQIVPSTKRFVPRRRSMRRQHARCRQARG